MTTGHQIHYAESNDASVNEAIADWFDDAFRIYGEVVDSQLRLFVALLRAGTSGFGLAERTGDMAERLTSFAVSRARPADRATPAPGPTIDAPERPVPATPSLAAGPREDVPSANVDQAGLAEATDAEPDTELDTLAGAQGADVTGADEVDQVDQIGLAGPTDDEAPDTDTDTDEARTDAGDVLDDTAGDVGDAGVGGAGFESAADVEAEDTSGEDTGEAAPANTDADNTEPEDHAGPGTTMAALDTAADAEAEDMATTETQDTGTGTGHTDADADGTGEAGGTAEAGGSAQGEDGEAAGPRAARIASGGRGRAGGERGRVARPGGGTARRKASGTAQETRRTTKSSGRDTSDGSGEGSSRGSDAGGSSRSTGSAGERRARTTRR